jgi:hypothetical protein
MLAEGRTEMGEEIFKNLTASLWEAAAAGDSQVHTCIYSYIYVCIYAYNECLYVYRQEVDRLLHRGMLLLHEIHRLRVPRARWCILLRSPRHGSTCINMVVRVSTW